jgi:hypothetical protein
MLLAAILVAACGNGQSLTPTTPTTPPAGGAAINLRCAVGTASCSDAMQGQAVTFTAERGLNAGTIRAATLDFGDGANAELGTLPTPASVSHVYAQTGAFTARLSAVDAAGQSQGATQVVQVGTLVTTSMGLTHLGNLNVLATADVRGAQVVLYEWIFEGTSPNVATISNEARYTFTTSGFKDVAMRATLSDGRTVRASASVIVE